LKYSDAVLTRVRHLERVGSLEGEHVGTGEIGTLDEGTVVRIQVRRDGDRIAEARFKVFGCSAAIASASLVTEWLEGARIDEAQRVSPERVVQTLELAPERHHVARMAVDAGMKAVKDART
jgi:NifU-like protein involved in Fe-S cluster formation